MPIVTIVVGIMLTLLGLQGCFAHEPSTISAGTPFWIGLALLLFGVLAFKARMIAMHVAPIVALVGFLLGAAGLFKRMTGAGVSSFAALNHTLMMLVCGIFIALCVNSFMRARRKRAKERAAAA